MKSAFLGSVLAAALISLTGCDATVTTVQTGSPSVPLSSNGPYLSLDGSAATATACRGLVGAPASLRALQRNTGVADDPQLVPKRTLIRKWAAAYRYASDTSGLNPTTAAQMARVGGLLTSAATAMNNAETARNTPDRIAAALPLVTVIDADC